MKSRAQPSRRRRTIILASGAALLGWLVISRSVAAYLADVAPRSALWLNPGEAAALVTLADRSVNPPEKAASLLSEAPPHEQKQTAAAPAPESFDPSQAFNIVEQGASIDVPKIRTWAAAAVERMPLNARAFRILGQLASISNDDRAAAKYMATAAQLSLHESIAVYWMMRASAAAGDYQKAIFYADALLRTDPDAMKYVEPLLARFAEQKSSDGFIKSMLKTNPPWRDAFFANLPRFISDARTPLDLLLALRTSPTPPDPEEINDYLSFLIAHQFYELAYYTWLQFLPPDVLQTVDLLFNGKFGSAPSGSPFDWTITQGSGVTVDVVPISDAINEHALQVDFLFGRVDYHSVKELIVLAPGTYQFSGRYRGNLVGPRGLKWQLVCADAAQTSIGESAMIIGRASTWKDVGFGFTVPATSCPAQYVRLDLDARTASEDLVSGSIMFDDLRIGRAVNPAPAQESTK
jgi:tetratricopeptide (TPR) repeat protein